jgi:ankyrin repeat protein
MPETKQSKQKSVGFLADSAKDGWTPLRYAERHGRTEVVEALRQHGGRDGTRHYVALLKTSLTA